MVKEYIVKTRISDDEMGKMEGQFIDEQCISKVIKHDADIYRLDTKGNKILLAKCKCGEWYNKKKNEGFSAEELDDLIMKEGKYGKYYTKESITETRHDAYADQKFPVWKPKLSSYQVLPPKPHN